MNDELVQFANSLNPSASVNQIWYSPPVKFDSDVVDAIATTAPLKVVSNLPTSCPVPVMMLCTSTVLRRLECCSFREDGLSHNEAENITQEHSTLGAEVTFKQYFVLQADQRRPILASPKRKPTAPKGGHFRLNCVVFNGRSPIPWQQAGSRYEAPAIKLGVCR